MISIRLCRSSSRTLGKGVFYCINFICIASHAERRIYFLDSVQIDSKTSMARHYLSNMEF